MEIIIALAIIFLGAYFSARMAEARGRNSMKWGILSVLFSPILTLPLLAIIGNASGYEPRNNEAKPLKRIRPLTPVSENPVTQLEKITNLKDTGALNEEEFQAAKAKILSKM